MYAIIKTGGKQYTVKPGDVLDVEKIEGEAGDAFDLEVLFVNADGKIITDPDELAKIAVTAEIIDQHKGKKAIVFKFKKRKGYKRTKGHRQQLTKIRITAIGDEKAEEPEVVEEVAEPEVAEVAEPEVVEEVVEAAEEEVEEAAEDVDLSKLTVAQLKDIAKEKDIKIPSGARKADIIELIQNA